ncbi:MAG: hypothetical protein ACOCT0_06090, partial [Halobacteriota archaeon]
MNCIRRQHKTTPDADYTRPIDGDHAQMYGDEDIRGDCLLTNVKKPSLSLLELLDQAEPLKSPVAMLVFSTGVEKYIHAHRPKDFPRASTRGHFDVCKLRRTPFPPEGRLASIAGVSRDTYIEGDHTRRDYDVEGIVPGLNDESPPEVMV